MFRLAELYHTKVVVTAHRGFSGRYPENTLLAFRQAMELRADDLKVDVIEFDVRGSKDHVPVVLHDPTLDRTSNAAGSPNQYTLDELRRFNFSYWQGAHNTGRRLLEPAYPDVTIPTLRQVLDLAKGRVGLNIQAYETGERLLSEICRLYDEYDLYDQGYLTMSTYREAKQVRKMNPRIELCVLERQERMDREALQEQKAFGCKYVQPRRADVDPAFCQAVKALGLYANMFYSNTDADNRRFIGYGVQGILTDAPDVLLKTIKDLA